MRRALEELLRSPAFAGVTSLGHRSLADAPVSPKLTQHVVDLEDAAGYDDPGVHVYHWDEFSALARAAS
ncbi:hypothetical protein OV079_22445 [Nannocystis pusilla]|uniref:Uncharacterized protein n=1 Tax=Nannocystis pusilla TaxID=889268 RepID=A0A9X3EQ56_9BACT|nr:hypothetical protein [Nannocystis pusilla]MCY1008269.1 hypothetical protein [Nannocystis pusilla]